MAVQKYRLLTELSLSLPLSPSLFFERRWHFARWHRAHNIVSEEQDISKNILENIPILKKHNTILGNTTFQRAQRQEIESLVLWNVAAFFEVLMWFDLQGNHNFLDLI